MKDFKYEPDFYDCDRNVFIEVAGTRQAFEANREKYHEFIKAFPQLNFEIRRTDGSLINLTDKNKFGKNRKISK